jgi:hypothetical protein
MEEPDDLPLPADRLEKVLGHRLAEHVIIGGDVKDDRRVL